jgi:electron transfer flavoprotein beta subunit
VLGIDSQMNVPRLPTVLQILKVKADRVTKVSLSSAGLSVSAPDLAATSALVACSPGAVERKRIVLEGPAHESAIRLVDALRQEGVL